MLARRKAAWVAAERFAEHFPTPADAVVVLIAAHRGCLKIEMSVARVLEAARSIHIAGMAEPAFQNQALARQRVRAAACKHNLIQRAALRPLPDFARYRPVPHNSGRGPDKALGFDRLLRVGRHKSSAAFLWKMSDKWARRPARDADALR